jgi:hypothetical protein
MKTVVLDLLRRYLHVEHYFQQGKRHHPTSPHDTSGTDNLLE